MTNSKLPDLLVVGAGPVGCRVAAEVARVGYEVVILEQKPSLEAPICCTALISDECRRRFNLGAELIIRSFASATVFSPGGEAVSVCREQVQAHALGRPALDEWLYRAAIAQGAIGLFGGRVNAILPENDGMTAKIAWDGQVENIKARAVVLAAGFGSHLPGTLGLKRAADWTMGVQAEAETTEEAEAEIYTGRAYAPGFFAWLVPTAPGQAHVGLMTRRRTKAHFETFLARLRRNGKIKGVSPPSFRGISLAPLSRTYGARLLVAGDLAGQVKPITGGGLYFGLLCADAAARHLTAALGKDDLSARTLSAYEGEWRALLGKELRLGRCARRAYGLWGDRSLEFFFGVAKRHTLAERLAESGDIGFDWHGAAISRAWRLLSPFS